MSAVFVATTESEDRPTSGPDPVVPVFPSVETEPVADEGDAADDACIWVHPTDPSQSTIIGTNKQRGLVVFNLAGDCIQELPDGRLNNVDVRCQFPLGGQSVDIVCSENRTNDTVMIYRVDPRTRQLSRVDTGTIRHQATAYGCCLYRSRKSGDFYVFVGSKSGVVEQWRLVADGPDTVTGRKVRTFDVGATVEGCVADDELGHLYIAEEMAGIWKYSAEPSGGMRRRLVDSATAPGGHVRPQVEGLTIYYGTGGKGYLIASSQRADEFVIYGREGDNAYVATFEILGTGKVDGVTHTDGIDVISCPLGPMFPDGVFVAQDHINESGPQNFKLVRWREIATAVSPPLKVDLSWSQRRHDSG